MMKTHGRLRIGLSDRFLVATVLAVLTAMLCAFLAQSPLLVRENALPLAASFTVSLGGYFATRKLAGSAHYKQMFIDANLRGIDLNKITTKRDAKGELVRPIEGIKIPEALGVICAAVYIVCLSIFIPFAFKKSFPHGRGDFPHSRLTEFVAALLSVSLMAFLGFVDNVLNLRWRDKLVLPTIATLPLLLVYFANIGVTCMLVPIHFQWIFGTYLDIGPLFYMFLMGMAVFSTNAINILAGVNGLEAGQSVVIGASLVVYNFTQLCRMEDENIQHNHLFSIYILLPFVGASTGLLTRNWFPAQVFVGDTFCYFAGMTFAVAGILGHYSKTLCLFFIPQILNFIYSIPQLIRVLPCPRHRMPMLVTVRSEVEGAHTPSDDPSEGRRRKKGETIPECSTYGTPVEKRKKNGVENACYPPPAVQVQQTSSSSCSTYGTPVQQTGRKESDGEGDGERMREANGGFPLGCSYLECAPSELGVLGKLSYDIICRLRLAKVIPSEKEDGLVKISNLTLINFFLYIFGPMDERSLTCVLLFFQILCSLAAFFIRFWLAAAMYEIVE